MAHHWISGSIALALSLVPLFAFGFAGEFCRRWANSLPLAARLSLPAVLAIPYLLVAALAHTVTAEWAAVYAFAPVVISALLYAAARLDLRQRGHLLDFLVLIPLGLAVDLRWLEPAWPAGMSVIGKLVLLDAGLYGFMAIRQLSGVGFDLRISGRDVWVGLREFILYAPFAIALGLGIGFLHLHGHLSRPVWEFVPAWVFTFVAVALPEEIFFRGWMQNLFERRIGRRPALLLTACLFGLSHFNKRTLHFNWRYVLLAAIAGVFYGRAWRANRRIAASAITHATVDTVWGALLR